MLQHLRQLACLNGECQQHLTSWASAAINELSTLPSPPRLLPPPPASGRRAGGGPSSAVHTQVTGILHETLTGGAWYLNNVCEQLSVSDTFLDNTAQQGGAVAILNPAISSGRYILSVQPAGGALVLPTILRLPCGVNSALANATFEHNKAAVSGGAVYASSTPVVSSSLAGAHALNSCLDCKLPCKDCASAPLTVLPRGCLQHAMLIWLQKCVLRLPAVINMQAEQMLTT